MKCSCSQNDYNFPLLSQKKRFFKHELEIKSFSPLVLAVLTIVESWSSWDNYVLLAGCMTYSKVLFIP